MNKKALYEHIMKSVSKEVKKTLNEELGGKYARNLRNSRREAFNKHFDELNDLLDNDEYEELHLSIVELVRIKHKDEIAEYIEGDSNIDIYYFIELLLEHLPIEIHDSVARQEILSVICSVLNNECNINISYNDLYDMYMLF